MFVGSDGPNRRNRLTLERVPAEVALPVFFLHMSQTVSFFTQNGQIVFFQTVFKCVEVGVRDDARAQRERLQWLAALFAFPLSGWEASFGLTWKFVRCGAVKGEIRSFSQTVSR